jgi:hypothetical protein
MPLDHVTAMAAWSRSGAPSSRDRGVSTTWVIGWWSAKPRIHDGIVATGTNALLG